MLDQPSMIKRPVLDLGDAAAWSASMPETWAAALPAA